MTAVGDRVGAVQSADDVQVLLYGFGVYAGDFPAPELPFGATRDVLMAEWADVLPDEAKRAAAVDQLANRPNPRIDLDDNRGSVWGMHCWWGSEAGVRAMFAGRKVLLVNPITREVEGELPADG